MSVEPEKQRRLELAVFWASLVVLAGMLIGLIWLELPVGDEQALVAARITQVSRQGEQLVAHFEVMNEGETPASEVVVRVIVPEARAVVEQTIAHVPAGATRRGVAVLYDVANDLEPVARVVGYQQP